MAVIFAFLFFLFVANTSFAATVADFIEFTPIAAVSNGYAFGTSEIKINNSTFYTLSFKKGKDVFALVPDDMLYGTYPNLEYTGLAINDNMVIVGGREKSKTAYPWVFLFQIQKERVAFLDIISAATVNDYVFNFEYQLPNIHAPKNIQDVDKDGIKEFGLVFYELGVNIFIEVHNDGLKIDYLKTTSMKILSTTLKIKAVNKESIMEKMIVLIYSILKIEALFYDFNDKNSLKLLYSIDDMKNMLNLEVHNNEICSELKKIEYLELNTFKKIIITDIRNYFLKYEKYTL